MHYPPKNENSRNQYLPPHLFYFFPLSCLPSIVELFNLYNPVNWSTDLWRKKRRWETGYVLACTFLTLLPLQRRGFRRPFPTAHCFCGDKRERGENGFMHQAMTHVKQIGFRPASYNFNLLCYSKWSEFNLLRINDIYLKKKRKWFSHLGGWALGPAPTHITLEKV